MCNVKIAHCSNKEKFISILLKNEALIHFHMKRNIQLEHGITIRHILQYQNEILFPYVQKQLFFVLIKNINMLV